MKALITPLAIGLTSTLFAQTNNPSTVENNSLITISQVLKEKEIPAPNDEGTNNPVVTGSTEYIQGDKKYYVKSNEQITIIFEEKTPH